MNAPDVLCNLRMVRADFTPDSDRHGPTGHCFIVTVRSGEAEACINIPEKYAELFAAEIEAMAAIIRSKVIAEQHRNGITD